VTEARLLLGRRLAILRHNAGALNPIQFRPSAAATSQPRRTGPLSWSGHHGESAARLYWRLPVSFRSILGSVVVTQAEGSGSADHPRYGIPVAPAEG